ncbi:MAG: HAD family hydrolase [Myxococcales bacterium]|nr:HAD family hydrolase [Myxococcales bacterium]
MTGSIAFFDLDLTLLSVNAGKLWVQHEYRRGRITRLQAARAGVWIAAYHLGYGKMDQILTDAIGTLAGQTEADLRSDSLSFYEREVAHHLRPGALTAVEGHRAAGDTLALLTSSSPYLCEPVQRALDIPHALCNRFELRDGRFTGKPELPLCFGAGKLTYARRLATRMGVTLKDCTFYTDSWSDLPVLEAIGRPVVVHPDPRLARVAKERGWDIQRW